MRELEVLDRGNSRSRLTVTPTRVSLKVGRDDAAIKAKLMEFAAKVAEADIPVTRSYRGSFEIVTVYEAYLKPESRDEGLWITLSDTGELSYRFTDKTT